MKRFNKASAAAVSGALVTIIASFFVIDNELQGATQTVITAILVYLIPNQDLAKEAAQEVLNKLRNGD